MPPIVAGDTGHIAKHNEIDAALAAIPVQIADLQAQSASIEDLFVSALLVPYGATVSNSQSLPVFTVPFPLAITSITLVTWEGAVAVSDTNYWTVEPRVMDVTGVTARAVADKWTKTTAGTYPAGEAIVRRKPWTFNTAQILAPNCVAGEGVHIAFLPTGTPTAIAGSILVTLGYRPL